MWRIGPGDHAAVHRAARDEKVHIRGHRIGADQLFAALTEEIAWRAGQSVLGEQAWMRVLSAVGCLTRRHRKHASSRSPRTSGPGSQTPAAARADRDRQQARVDLVRQCTPAARALCTFRAQRARTFQPASSSWSWTKRAPVVDSITPITSSGANRSTSRASPPLSGDTTAPVAPCFRHARSRAIRDACGSDRFRGRSFLGLLEVGCVEGLPSGGRHQSAACAAGGAGLHRGSLRPRAASPRTR